jgi:tetratricopeptide (TPR) repeat protein
LAVLVLTVALIYGNSLSSDFVWDDENIVVNRGEFFADSSNITTILNSEDSAHVYGKGNPYYRPLSTLTYMLDYHLWGHQPFWYHLENLLLHTLAVILVFLLVDSVFDDRFLAFTTSILFALYPVNSESVNFVSARNNILCTGLVFASLLTLRKSRNGGRRWALGALWLFFLSLLSKEPAVVTPFFLASLALFSRERELRASNPILLSFLAVLLVYFIIRHLVLGTFTSEAGPELSVEKMKLIAAVYFENFRLILFPFRLNAHYTQEYLAFGWAKAVVAASGSSLLIFFSVWRRSPGPIRAGSQWVLWGLLPVSNLVSIPSAPVAERYLYAVTPGSALVMAYLLRQLLRRRRGVSLAMIAAMVVSLGARTLTRNRVWADNLVLDKSMIQADPSNSSAHMNLGITYSNLGRFQAGERELRESTRLDPSNQRAHFNLAALYIKQNRLPEAAQANEAAVRIAPSYAKARSSLGVIYTKLGRYEAAMRELQAAVRLDPDLAEGHNNLGMLYGELGRLEEALAEFQMAARLGSNLAETHFNLGLAHMKLGHVDQARRAFGRAAELDSRYEKWSVNEQEN